MAKRIYMPIPTNMSPDRSASYIKQKANNLIQKIIGFITIKPQC
ncbi:hypothetical protein OAT16_03670 [Prolixibacteraceae bacterium]|nr:hypothetical protein [Prolixibacteraceae bacterium]